MPNSPSKVKQYLLALVLLAGCQSQPVPETKETPVIAPTPLKSETKSSINYVINHVPAPLEITTIIKETGVAINTNLINPIVNSEQYATNYSKAINLGVYGADLSYLVVYSQPQLSLKYLATCKQLADGLGINTAFDQYLITQFEKNINSSDSLMELIYPAYKRIDEYLRSNERAGLATLVLTGGYIEGLHLSIQIAANNPRDEANELLYTKLEEQAKPLVRILELLQEQKDVADFVKLFKELSKIQDIFKSVSNQGITREQIKAIDTVISVMRSELIRN